jgi:glycosyltransferase involved in cell wall biosynthesis
VIPCLNEERAIEAVVRQGREHLPNVIVVDDGSRDATARRAETAGAQVIHHSGNRGKGAALRTGLQRARQLGFDWAMVMDGDGQHAASDLPRFLDCAGTTGATLVIGNRMHAAAQMPWLRREVNRWMSRRLSRLARRDWPDTQCGFRLMRLAEWSKLALRTERFEIESESILAFAAAGCLIEFVPIQVIYKAERSKIHPLADAWRWFRWLRTHRRN